MGLLTSIASVVVNNLIVVLLVAAVILGGTLEVEKTEAAVVVEVDVEEAVVAADVTFALCSFLLHNTFCV